MLEGMGSLVNQGAETELYWLLSGGPGTGLRRPKLPQVTLPVYILRHLHVITSGIAAAPATLVSF